MTFQAEAYNRLMPGDNRYQQTITGGNQDRLDLAIFLADQEYSHPECEKANSSDKQRSFCFHQQEITDIAILVIHGWTSCPFEVRELGEKLYHQGYNVYGVRLAGHGTSITNFAGASHTDWEMSARKGLAITALLGRKVIIVGESMGGGLAAILAAEYPELVAKIALCAPCFQILDWRAGLTVYPWLTPFLPREADFGVFPDWQKDYWYNKIPTSGVAELAKITKRARLMGSKINADTLIVQAENDSLVNPKGARKFFQSMNRLTMEQKELIMFKDGHHNLTVDLNPQKEQVFQWIIQFIG